jgi:hypothetical protein
VATKNIKDVKATAKMIVIANGLRSGMPHATSMLAPVNAIKCPKHVGANDGEQQPECRGRNKRNIKPRTHRN